MKFEPGKLYETHGDNVIPPKKCVYVGVNSLATDPSERHVFAFADGDTITTDDSGRVLSSEGRWDVVREWRERVKVYVVAWVTPGGIRSAYGDSSKTEVERCIRNRSDCRISAIQEVELTVP